MSEVTDSLGMNVCMAMDEMKKIPERTEEEVAKAEAKTGGKLSKSEEAAIKESVAASAMLSMVGAEVKDQEGLQKALQADIDSNHGQESEELLDAAIQEQLSDLGETLDDADQDDVDNLGGADTVGTVEDEDDLAAQAADMEGAELAASAEKGASLVEQKGAVATKGEGPLKWLFKHGIGWLIARVSWLVIFLLGASLGLFRGAVLFPLMLVSCTLFKIATYLFKDVGYNLLWEGETKYLGNFKKIGKCPKQMWGAVGFDTDAKHVAAQVVIQPAKFASWATNVHHVLKTGCSHTCPTNAVCHQGRCHCLAGFYADPTKTSCGQIMTANGCVCRTTFHEAGILLKTTLHGCPANIRKCKVDKRHPSFHTCSSRVPRQSYWFSSALWDMCTPMPESQFLKN
eukprot:gnl/TRDRNA2_/TRDRNA2_173799_c0_seq12.p1 gnl/TRDRNA2_/TRDRNA2_173799_c0~~gnl/TRDRNA2_/TRDRNA2_173799_c0_seq12.p1  ORF type:complete len:454 (+),score=106.20 gnl/TRDRNA2_/TRDRNA2_173799_c0_seq12:164-1363(+)